MINPYSILKYPLSTEKAVREMETSNTLLFVVSKRANKKKVKWAIEKEFGVKVLDVRTLISQDGTKKAYIKLHMDTPAVDVTTKLGLV